MRSVAALCALVCLVLGAGIGHAKAPIATNALQPAATPGDGTPIVDPQPELHPVFLPLVAKDYDPFLPVPVGNALEGYLASLTRAGRDACAPATHVLLTQPEGTRGAQTVAVVYAARPEPALNLDFYLSEYIQVTGATDLAPAACSIVWRSMRVSSIVVLDRPPR